MKYITWEEFKDLSGDLRSSLVLTYKKHRIHLSDLSVHLHHHIFTEEKKKFKIETKETIRRRLFPSPLVLGLDGSYFFERIIK